MTLAGRSLRSGVEAAIISLIISTIVFVALGVPIQLEETPMIPAFLLVGASFTAFCSATIAVYVALKREMSSRKT